MGAEIDRLEVQVEAQATKANNQLDKLVGKLDVLSSSLANLNSSGLAGLANGVSKFAQASAQLSNVKTADFTRLTKNIQSLANLNTQQIFNASSAIVTLSNALGSLSGVSESSVQVSEVAKNISKLGGANVQRAITNLPALAAAMNNLMTTLSRAPQVSSNVIQMTRAMADLAAQGARVGSASTSITNSVNRVGNAMSANAKKASSFSSMIGRLYQRYFLLKRVADKLWDSIEGSMDYVEVLNYFDAAFGQVAESAVSQWESAGASSAEAYYESFSSRAKELTSKMTGFDINDDGTLTATGEASMGINPTQLMNYQATFAQMSSSMGVASETSLLLSQALTEIGADLASVKNMDFDKVWNDMASGLAGMSRTMDKYGVNIRNVNLQQKLLDLGINENITNLNQNDKALLRAIILLDSTRYAWGDLADTLEQPANQLRMLESNFSNLSRTIGNLFLPMVSKVLPYVNGLVIGIQRLFAWVGNLLGIDLSGITSAVGDSAVDIGDLLGDTDDLTDSLTDAGNAAKKLKSNLQGFDELNVITTQSDSESTGTGTGVSSGLLAEAFAKAFSEYQEAWDEAFANMENKANDFADKVETALKPVRDIIEDFAIGDFFKAGQDTSHLVAGIFNFFADAIDNVDWYGIGQDIGDYLAGIEWNEIIKSAFKLSTSIWDLINETWLGAFDAAPIETSVISAIALLKWTGLGNVFKNAISSKFPTSLSIGKTIAITGITFTLAFDIGKFLSKKIVEWANEKHEWGLSQEWIDNFFAEFTISDLFSEDAIKVGTELFGGPEALWFMLFGEKIDIEEWLNENVMPWLSGEKWAELGYNAGQSLGNKLTEFTTWWDTDVQTWWDGVTSWFAKEKWQELGNNVKSALSGKWAEFTGWWGRTGIPDWWGDNVSPWFTEEKWENLGANVKSGLSEKWEEFITWWQNTGLYNWWKNDVEPFFNKDAWSWQGIKEGLSDAWSAAIEAIKNLWNNFANWLNDKLTINIDTSSIIGKGISEILGTTQLSLGVIPTFSIGGFPEDGLFMANHNELVGQFSNGKTAVANNEQIISGIADAVYPAVYNAVSSALKNNTSSTNIPEIRVYIGNREITDVAIDGINERYRRGLKPLKI